MRFGVDRGLVRAVGPRRLDTARTALAGVVGAACLGYSAVALVRPEGAGWVDAVAVGVLVAVAVCLLRLPDVAAAALCVLTHLLGIAVILVLDLVSADASVVGQVFSYLPVLSAASQLRVPGAVLVTTAAVGAEAAVVLALLPPERAWTELAFVATTLVTTTVAVARAGVLQDRLVAQLQRQAGADPLTGLVTRRVLDDALTGAVEVAQRPGAAGACLLVVDVDHFKEVNDRYGHPVGDQALVHVAHLVRAHTRHDGDVVARLGGDELALLLPECAHEAGLRRAHALAGEVASTPLRLADGTEVPLSVSIGAAHGPDHAVTARSLYARADEALYAVKRTGRGRAGGVPVPQAAPHRELRPGPRPEPAPTA